MPVTPLSFDGFVEEVYNRLGEEIGRAEIKKVLKAMSEEVGDCVRYGYRVSLPGLVKFEPRYVAARPKRMGVNPRTGEPAQLAAKPASFKVKATALPSLGKVLPSTKSKAGQELAEALSA
jgi:nucleoid DNA-binding protein